MIETSYEVPKFGDIKIIELLRRNKTKDLEKTRITISLKSFIDIGMERAVALNLIERLVNKKK